MYSLVHGMGEYISVNVYVRFCVCMSNVYRNLSHLDLCLCFCLCLCFAEYMYKVFIFHGARYGNMGSY